jgi:hypothetical protein
MGIHRHGALEAAAEAADLAGANQMEIIAASADVITAPVLAMRADSGAARSHVSPLPSRQEATA